MARGLLYGLDAAAGHREASGLGAILLTLALSFAAQNAVTALRMQAGPPLAPLAQIRTRRRPRIRTRVMRCDRNATRARDDARQP